MQKCTNNTNQQNSILQITKQNAWTRNVDHSNKSDSARGTRYRIGESDVQLQHTKRSKE